MSAHTYEYARPALTTDIVLFTFLNKKLQVLLVERGVEPFKGCLALPGGFVREGEIVADCATRELKEETNIDLKLHREVGCFSEPRRDPRGWVVSIAYSALVPATGLRPQAGGDAAKALWTPVLDLIGLEHDESSKARHRESDLFEQKAASPELAFDHQHILRLAYERLSSEISYGHKVEQRAAQASLLFELLPETFTMPDAADLMSELSASPVQRANFRKWILEFVEIVEMEDEDLDSRALQRFRAKPRETEETREALLMRQAIVRKEFKNFPTITGLHRIVPALARLPEQIYEEIKIRLGQYRDGDVYSIKATPVPSIHIADVATKKVIERIDLLPERRRRIIKTD